MRRRKLVATAGALSVTAFAATLAHRRELRAGGPGRARLARRPPRRPPPSGSRRKPTPARPTGAAYPPSRPAARPPGRRLTRSGSCPRKTHSGLTACQHLDELGGERLLHPHRLAGDRVHEGQLAGVQERPVEVDRRPASAIAGSPTTGWPMAWRCTRIWWVRPVSSRQSSTRPTARGRRRRPRTGARPRPPSRTAIRVGRRTERPIGASITPAAPRARPTPARGSRRHVVRGEHRDQRVVGAPVSARPRADRWCRGRAGARCPGAPGHRRRRSPGSSASRPLTSVPSGCRRPDAPPARRASPPPRGRRPRSAPRRRSTGRRPGARRLRLGQHLDHAAGSRACGSSAPVRRRPAPRPSARGPAPRGGSTR